jgi:hypothetical protein
MAAPIPNPPQAPKARIHPVSIVMAVTGIATCIIGGITAIGAATGNPAAGTSPSPVYVTVTPAGATGASQPPQAAPKTSPPKPPPPTIEDGIWTVGADMPAGRYRVTANVSSGCYWAITKTGSNGDDIISNDLPSGGRPTVTLKAGQDFTSQDCGTWAKT